VRKRALHGIKEDKKSKKKNAKVFGVTVMLIYSLRNTLISVLKKRIEVL
jgi:hypothetical protein